MNWRVAESLQVLLRQLNEAFPRRSKVSDGSIGDAKHASRSSDHNPYIRDSKGQPIVTARDFTHDPRTGIDCNWLAEQLVKHKDPRIKYIIWNKRICSSQKSPWQWRPYSGVNAHTKHLHLSVEGTQFLFDGMALWKLDFPNDESDDVAKIQVSGPAPAAENVASLTGGLTSRQPTATLGDSAGPQEPAPNDIVPPEQTQPAVTNTVVEEKIVESTPTGEKTTTKTAESVATPVEVKKEKPSIVVMIGAAITWLTGIGFNVGSFIQTKLEAMTPQQIGWMVAMLGLPLAAIFWWQRSAKAAQNRTLALMDKAADRDLNTVILVDKKPQQPSISSPVPPSE